MLRGKMMMTMLRLKMKLKMGGSSSSSSSIREVPVSWQRVSASQPPWGNDGMRYYSG